MKIFFLFICSSLMTIPFSAQSKDIILADSAYTLQVNGEFEKAIEIYNEQLNNYPYEDYLKIRILNESGYCYRDLEKNEIAITRFKSALELTEKFNYDSIKVEILLNLAEVHTILGIIDSSKIFLDQALETALKYGNKVQISYAYNNLGAYYNAIGDYKEAAESYYKSIEIGKEVLPESEFSVDYNNLANVYMQWGKCDVALEYLNRALEIDKASGNEKFIGVRLSNIGMVYKQWGKYNSAYNYLKQGFQIAEKYHQVNSMISRLNNLGLVCINMDSLDRALEYLNKSSDLQTETGQNQFRHLTLNQIGSVYFKKMDYEKSEYYYKEAMRLEKESGNFKDISVKLHNIGDVYFIQKRFPEAINYYSEAIDSAIKYGQVYRIASHYSALGSALYKLKSYNEAITNLSKGIELIENTRKTAPGDLKMDYIESQLDTYKYLAACYLMTDKPDAAINTIEAYKSRYLAEQISNTNAVDSINIDFNQIRDELNEGEMILYIADLYPALPVTTFIFTNDSIKVVNKNYEQLNSLITGDIFSLIREFNTIGENSPDSSANDFANIHLFYKQLLQKADPDFSDFEAMEIISRSLYKFYLSEGIELSGNRNLTFITDGITRSIPFESLIDSIGNYLIENHNVTYLFSINTRQKLKTIHYPLNRNKIIAFGGAIYDLDDQIIYELAAVDYVKNIRNNSSVELERSGEMKDIFGRIGYKKFPNLPGSLNEVMEITDLMKDSKVITGADVNETKIKEMSENNELKDFQIIHFAVHGLVFPEYPELSSLILSQVDSSTSEDNFLRIGEISKLKINADLVNLSACQSGLGKDYKGEGTIGPVQAFIVAGAKSVIATKWNIQDAASSKFMVQMYSLMIDENYSASMALSETKRLFLKTNYKLPYFWAGFTFYGDN